MLKIKKISGLSCREVAAALSQKVDHIHWWLHLKIKLHLMRCETCANYAAHLGMIVNKFKELISKRRMVPQDKINELEDKILSTLKSKQK
jgi:predicted anti-sigma-YlaC factor YlaD